MTNSYTTSNNSLTANLVLELTPTKLSQLENDVGYITDADIGSMGTTVNNLQTTVSGLQTQVGANQAQVADNTNSITSLTTQLTEAQTNITNNASTIATNSQQLVDFQAWGQNKVTELSTQIADNTTAINNKANASDVPTKVSELANDVDFQTLTQVMQLLSTTQLLQTVVVDTKPSVDEAKPNTIYLVPLSDQSGYEMWLLSTGQADNQLINLGTTVVNLDEYITTDDLSKALALYQPALSTDQLNAVNSGITSAKVSTYDSYGNTIAQKANTTDVVTLISNQNIAGVKTFDGGIITNNVTTSTANSALTINTTTQGIQFASNTNLAPTTDYASGVACGVKSKAIMAESIYTNAIQNISAGVTKTFTLPQQSGALVCSNQSEIWTFTLADGTQVTKQVGVFG